jgi:serine protease 16
MWSYDDFQKTYGNGCFHPFGLYLLTFSRLLAACSDDDGNRAPLIDVTRWYNEQQLDHFSPEETRTWQQRYFVNDEFFDGSGPVFLCVGGEGSELTPDVVKTGTVHCAVMVELAKEIGGLILALEHRYYGESQPVPNLSTANLKWLTSRQALGDIAQFHGYICEKYHLKDNNRWITFGGSYPGMLAAWARIKYSDLIFAAVSSSAPVEAHYNMQGFNDVMAQSMGATIVGGSAQCVELIRQAFSDLGSLLSSIEGRQFLYDRFNLCTGEAESDPLKDPYDQFQFLYYLSTQDGIDLSGPLTGSLFPVQSNDPNCREVACSIEKVCSDFMLNNDLGEPIDRLASLWSLYAGENCTSVDYQIATIAPLLDTSLSSWPNRSWQYQACNEFGFFPDL